MLPIALHARGNWHSLAVFFVSLFFGVDQYYLGRPFNVMGEICTCKGKVSRKDIILKSVRQFSDIL